MRGLTLASLFDGIGGFPLCAVRNGVTPMWASEIEPFPIMVTRKRFPQMMHLGNVSKISGAEVPPVDILTFGSPCQDLSVAGKQAGIHDGARSSLFFEAVRIIKEMRANAKADTGADEPVRPRWAVWENVPGAYSSHGGRDFQAVLRSFVSVKDPDADVPLPPKGKWQNAGCIVGDGYSIAWRTYDAQHWAGTPQRRKRIYLIADFGGERAGEILFKREDRAGHSEPGEAAREGTAGDAAAGAGRDDHNGIAYSLQGNMVDRNAMQNGCGWCKDNAHTLNQVDRHAVVYDTTQCTSPLNYSNPQPGDPCHPLAAQQHPPLVIYDARSNGNGDIAPTGTGDHNNRVTDYSVICVGNGQANQLNMGNRAGALNCMHDQQIVIHSAPQPRRYIARRLTPLECCRLQGYPDGWTEGMSITDPTEEEISFWLGVWAEWAEINGKKPKSRSGVIKWLQNAGSDSAEYKAYGNSLAIPCANDVIRRIAEFAKKEATHEHTPRDQIQR